MKSMIKGMIVFFSILLLSLVALMTYALVRGSSELPLIGGRRLINTQIAEMEDISDISIKNYSSDIFFKRSDGNDIVIKEYISNRSTQASFVTINQEGSSLNIYADKKSFNSWSIFGSSHRYFEVYLPESYQGAMRVDTSSGDVYAEIDLEFTDCSVNSASGYLKFEKLSAENISIKTSSGDINGKELNGKKKLSAKSGDINIDSSTGDAEISTSSGDVKLDEAKGNMDISTSSGNLRVDRLTGSARARSTSGDIQLNLSELTGDLSFETSSGYVSCKLPKDTGFKFWASTSSGDIKTDFDDSLSFNKKGSQAEGMIGDPAGHFVEVKTTSGDIKFSRR